MGLRDALIFVLTAPWLALGPANVYKISMINRGSPMAKYIVVPPAEECQAACNIARMWGCLFWGLQAVVAGGIVAGGVGDRTAAAAKLYVGAALAVAYKEDVVREVVAAGELVVVRGVQARHELLQARVLLGAPDGRAHEPVVDGARDVLAGPFRPIVGEAERALVVAVAPAHPVTRQRPTAAGYQWMDQRRLRVVGAAAPHFHEARRVGLLLGRFWTYGCE